MSAARPGHGIDRTRLRSVVSVRAAIASNGAAGCSADGECNTDPACLGVDPDCASPCGCDYFSGICEAMADATDAECPCDADCASAGDNACGEDGHCDTWCDPGGVCVDPDCSGGGPCAR
ncbi:MAG: hypothetical protein HY905_18850 [Deltaproteobacteria bacterium]|nr:hypothetical protein [Deltaproteobacteria bacterium]